MEALIYGHSPYHIFVVQAQWWMGKSKFVTVVTLMSISATFALRVSSQTLLQIPTLDKYSFQVRAGSKSCSDVPVACAQDLRTEVQVEPQTIHKKVSSEI